jgi:hypothetical protein
LTCREGCRNDLLNDEEFLETIESLLGSGKIKECFVVKRKEASASPKITSSKDKKPTSPVAKIPDSPEVAEEERLLILEDEQLKPFAPEDYTDSILYQVVETFDVERRFVPPEHPNTIVFEGKKPLKKTVPIIVSKDEGFTLLDSWEVLETKTEELSRAREIMGVIPVKQIFVLKKK